MQPSTLAGKKCAQDRIARHSGAVAWKKSGPYFELDGKSIDSQLLPHPLPPSSATTDADGFINRQGPVVVIPSPWVGGERQRKAARFWRSMGFVLRDATDTDGLICTDLKEWVRSLGALKGKKYTVAAWAAWVNRKYKEFYL